MTMAFDDEGLGPDLPLELEDLVSLWEDYCVRGRVDSRGRQRPDPLVALHANREAVLLLTTQRYLAVAGARAAGATWTQVGEALGVTRQSVHEAYRRTLTLQHEVRHALGEQIDAEFQDAYDDAVRPLPDEPGHDAS